MRKLLSIFGVLLLGSSVMYGSTSTVTATVTDPDGTVWANATWSLSFQVGVHDSNPAHYTVGGVALDPSVAYQTGTANGSGVISFTTYQNTSISPENSSFNLTVCPNASFRCTTVNFAPSSGSTNLTSLINGAITAPRFLGVSGAYGYTDAEAITQLKPGSTYWNVTSSTQRCYTGSAWGACSASGTSTAAWTLVQHVLVSGDICTAAGTTCTIPLIPTQAGDLLVTMNNQYTVAGRTIASITAGACTSSWVIPAGAAATKDLYGSAGAYCLNSAAGTTSITVTLNDTAVHWNAEVMEFHWSGTSISVDGTPSAIPATTTSGVPQTLTGTNDVVVQWVMTGGSFGVSGGYNTPLDVDLSGSLNGNPSGYAAIIGTSSGAAPIWYSSSPEVVGSMAFKGN